MKYELYRYTCTQSELLVHFFETIFAHEQNTNTLNIATMICPNVKLLNSSFIRVCDIRSFFFNLLKNVKVQSTRVKLGLSMT